MPKTSDKQKTEPLKSELSLDVALFDTSSRKDTLTERIFLIGFDTEYEKSDSIDKEEAKSNRVLSYQYCGRIVDEEGEHCDRQWSGIIYPKGHAVTDRLTIPEFLHYVIKDGLKRFPNLCFPSEIVLVAHFTRADVPGFREFKDKELREKLLLQNIRSLFMNIEKPFTVEFQGAGQAKPVKLKVSFRDTMALAPAGSRSLDDLGKILGVEKLTLSDDPDVEYSYKTQMSRLLADDRELFERYAIRDAEICAIYAARMIRASSDNLGVFALPNTLSSKGINLLLKFWGDNRVDPLKIVGKEEVMERLWSKKSNRWIKRKKTVFVQSLSWNEQFLTEAYHGGRGEQFWFGPAQEAVWYDYDLASAYPSAMTLIGTPDWSKIETITSTQRLLSEQFSASDLLFANVDFEFPESVRYPVLPVRTANGLIFPRKGNSTTHISEIRLAHRLGAKIVLNEAKYIKTSGGGDPAADLQLIRPFADFARYCVDQRNKYSKGMLQNLMWKEIVNSTYGKTAQGLRERRIYDLRDAETKLLPPSAITNPAFAAFITAFCRGTLGEIMNSLPDDVSIFSVTTDGFLTTASPDQMQAAATGELCGFYRKARSFLSDKSDIYEVKHIIRRPVGWRTRAQATLTPSNEVDWNGSGAKYFEDGSYVLAKGGIKLNGRLSKAEQNRDIVRLFANRYPEQILSYTIGSGIRAMYEEGSDFVDKDITKRLSMEFDWKRRPSQPQNENVAATLFPESMSTHLSFQSVPWDDVSQFNRTRELWEAFQQSSPLCLKSTSDLKAFSDYCVNIMSLDGEAGTYLRRRGGALARLREMVVVAIKHRAAGTHVRRAVQVGEDILNDNGNLSARKLARYLDEEIGIPCTQSDVENARRKKLFTPGRVPNTDETREKLDLLREKMFPKLKVNEFLAAPIEFELVHRAQISGNEDLLFSSETG